MTAYISVAIAFFGFLASVYFSGRTAKNQDVEKVKKEAARDAEINVKLDSIMRATTDTDKKIDRMQSNLDELRQDNVAMSHDFNALETRVGKAERQLELLHGQFREHVAKELAEQEG